MLECARANGDIVSSRKGIVGPAPAHQGRAAHAGVEPEKGRSAMLEAAHKTIALHALNGRWPGVTVNVGVIEGGTRPNVVAERALLKVDIRAVTRAALEEAEAAMREIAERVHGPGGHDHGRGARAPLADGEAGALDQAGRSREGTGECLGFELNDAAPAAPRTRTPPPGMGVPTLDGLGPDRRQRSLAAEYLEVDSIVPRVDAAGRAAAGRADDPEFRPG